VRSTWTREPRTIWAFWAAAGLVAIGGAVPFAVGGQSSRISSVFIPFAVAALAFAACALVHEQGRGMSSALYLLAGLAIVYGILTMFALPLMLAVLGTCPPPPAVCTTGLQHPLTVAENTGIGIAAVFGLAALFVGFIGLAVVYRRTGLPKVSPPIRTIPPVESTREPVASAEKPEPGATRPEPVAEAAGTEPEPELPASEPEPELPAPEKPAKTEPEPELPAPEPEPEPIARRPRTRSRRPAPEKAAKTEPEPELPAPEPELELPAPEEPLELPAHDPESPKT
jgi:hypothetical protein